MINDYGIPIQGFECYNIKKDGTVYNTWNEYALKPDKSDCVCFHRRGQKRKTLSIPRLVAIHYLGMPDDRKHRAYKKDANGGFGIDNIAWDSVSNLNKEVLIKARRAKLEYNNKEEVID